jgi:electron transport complex protein RnfD
MITDPVTSPTSKFGRVLYGAIAGSITVLIRISGAYPEGAAFSILIANMIACVLDHYEWSSSRYTWKKFLAMGLLIVVPALTIFLVIKFGGVLNG